MMSRFPKPNGAIENYEELRAGDEIHHVYGIWPPFNYGVCTVTKSPYQYREHPDYTPDSIQGDLFVFDVAHDDYCTMEFASDGNMVPGKSHNDNYWFRSKDDADAAVLYLRERWLADPSSIAKELEDRATLCDFYDDYDCHNDYDYGDEDWAA